MGNSRSDIHGSIRLSSTLFLVLCFLSSPAFAQRGYLAELLPADTSGWRLAGSPQSFVGDELFKMIDGGAALYKEYGFDRAISGKYEDGEGRGIDVEIYAMTDREAACGIFGITAAAGEKALPMGDDGEMGEYFLVFRKGPYVVTVSGQSADSLTMNGVRSIGRAIDARIRPGSQTPEFVARLQPLVASGSRPIFLRGVIAVGNFYIFAPQNIFNAYDGVTGERDSTRFFVFRYKSAGESAQCLQAAGQALRANDKYSGFRPASNSFAAVDRDGNLLRASLVGNAIIVVIGRHDGANRKLEKDIVAVLGKE
jgi:hypothetical protein